MMSVSELCSFRTTSESGTLSGQRSFQRACWCMIFVAESPNVMRWSGYGWSAIGNENFRRPRFSRNVLSIRGCYRLGTNGNGDRQERIQLQASAKGFGDFSFGYKVREGDTLTSIAKKYNVPIQTIAAFNEIIDVDYLPAGKVLLIPNADVTTGKDIAEDHKLSNFVKLRTSGGGTTSQTESSVIPMPVSSSAFCVQSWHVGI
ncbi:hypothetical protein KP509_26G038200 [Ceratopteris richardii]|uniref:LysM domain-containing protein n=1 Tax=Ceratopteris richardii TaxID=49495 RepID=A0A8T2RLE3_CERRI|nr:hypothetical protein KP509_26G038200 [Ceratopteris richardii]